ncbi:spore coat U domain-containing protein [Variovorax sp. Varisp62]|uniref:Csu type fimbrial protein n=1 Tax=Variovorax sp. Varisp62 TaxID=3243049 RepID=UPI0039B6401C
MNISKFGGGIAMVLAALAVPLQCAHATTATTTFKVTATVLSSCAMATPDTLAFGSFTPGTALTGTTSFTVQCTYGTTYSLGMSAGGSGSVTSRTMTSTTAASGYNSLSYGLYKDSSYATNWSNSTTGTDYTGTGSAVTYTVYGKIPAAQYAVAPATDYTDTITLTLTY